MYRFDFLKYCVTALLLFPLRLKRCTLRMADLEDGSTQGSSFLLLCLHLLQRCFVGVGSFVKIIIEIHI